MNIQAHELPELWRKEARDIRDRGLTCTYNSIFARADELEAALKASPVQAEAVGYTTGHCENHKRPGGCQLHNLQCGYPNCDRRPIANPQPPAASVEDVESQALDYVPGELDRTAPERIWLQVDTDGDNDSRDESWPGSDGVTWQDEQIGGLEIQYVRADTALRSRSGGVDAALSEALQLLDNADAILRNLTDNVLTAMWLLSVAAHGATSKTRGASLTTPARGMRDG